MFYGIYVRVFVLLAARGP